MITKNQALASGGAAALAVGVGTGASLTVRGKDSSTESGSVMPPGLTLLYSEEGFDTNYPKSGSTIGWLYGGYLTGTYRDSNKDWWQSSYNSWKSDSENATSLSVEFGKDKIELPFASKNPSSDITNANKALNKVCESVYKKEYKDSDISFGKSFDENKNKLGRDLLKYCSPLGQKPRTLEDTEEQVVTSLSSNRNSLVSVEDAENNLFWNLRNDDFFSSRENCWQGSTFDSSSYPKLHELYSKTKNGNMTVKEFCRESYSSEDSSSEGIGIIKICSWDYGIETD